MNLPKQMREPRKAKARHLTANAWYYVDPNSISVFAESEKGASTYCTLTRRQLEQALAIMDKHAAN